MAGVSPGDEVEVWFEARRQVSDSFTYSVVSDSNRHVLIGAAEDYTGASWDGRQRIVPGPTG